MIVIDDHCSHVSRESHSELHAFLQMCWVVTVGAASWRPGRAGGGAAARPARQRAPLRCGRGCSRLWRAPGVSELPRPEGKPVCDLLSPCG